jgi:hypothetical protein
MRSKDFNKRVTEIIREATPIKRKNPFRMAGFTLVIILVTGLLVTYGPEVPPRQSLEPEIVPSSSLPDPSSKPDAPRRELRFATGCSLSKMSSGLK